jgi:hypothetical protein
MLPDDFQNRIIPVQGTYAKLKPYRLGAGDLLFMKMAALRPQDVYDLDSFTLSISDMPAIKSGLDKLRLTNPSQCAFVQFWLRQKGLL